MAPEPTSPRRRPRLHPPGIARDAERYEAFLKANWKPGKAKPAELRVAAEKLSRADPRAASRSFADAVVPNDKNAESWLGLARALLGDHSPTPTTAPSATICPSMLGARPIVAYERATDAGRQGASARRARRGA